MVPPLTFEKAKALLNSTGRYVRIVHCNNASSLLMVSLDESFLKLALRYGYTRPTAFYLQWLDPCFYIARFARLVTSGRKCPFTSPRLREYYDMPFVDPYSRNAHFRNVVTRLSKSGFVIFDRPDLIGLEPYDTAPTPEIKIRAPQTFKENLEFQMYPPPCEFLKADQKVDALVSLKKSDMTTLGSLHDDIMRLSDNGDNRPLFYAFRKQLKTFAFIPELVETIKVTPDIVDSLLLYSSSHADLSEHIYSSILIARRELYACPALSCYPNTVLRTRDDTLELRPCYDHRYCGEPPTTLQQFIAALHGFTFRNFPDQDTSALVLHLPFSPVWTNGRAYSAAISACIRDYDDKHPATDVNILSSIRDRIVEIYRYSRDRRDASQQTANERGIPILDVNTRPAELPALIDKLYADILAKLNNEAMIDPIASQLLAKKNADYSLATEIVASIDAVAAQESWQQFCS